MSKKNLIEQALSALDTTAFHKFCDQYLSKKHIFKKLYSNQNF